jgi:hypothetical protein
MGGAAISANRTDPSLRTAMVGAATFDAGIVVLLSVAAEHIGGDGNCNELSPGQLANPNPC